MVFEKLLGCSSCVDFEDASACKHKGSMLHGLLWAHCLRPDRPFARFSGPEISKMPQKVSFGGSPKKTLQDTRSSQKYPKLKFWRVFLTFSGIFGDFFADPQEESFWDSFGILGPERPELRGTESRIANRTIPRIAGPESPEIRQREAQSESNRSKVESRKIDSESPSESHPINA